MTPTEVLTDWADRLAGLLDVNPTVECLSVRFAGGVELHVDEDGAAVNVPGMAQVLLDELPYEVAS